MTATPRPRWVTATVFGLVVMIVWTLVVKYLTPLLWSLSEALAGRDAANHLMWDFWPATHLLLALLLWRGARPTWIVGVGLSLAESAVVLVKITLFLGAPEWSFWKLLWFSNKIYVLGFFLCLLTVLLGPGRNSFDERRLPRWANE